MIDIAFFLVDLGGGGAEKVMLSLAGGFAERGLKVDLVLVKLEGDYLALIPPNVRVVNLSSPRLISSLPLLITYLKQNRPKIFVSALEDPNTLSIVAKMLARVPTRIIVTIHNHLSLSCQQSNQLKRKFTPTLVRWLFPFADAVVAVSQGVADDAASISDLPPANIKVIYNPIFTDDLLEKINEPVSHPWFIDNHIPVILGVGRLTKQKDFPTLIHAFSLVKQQYPVRLMILGQGEELPHLEALVKELNLFDDVSFPGFVANPYACMKQAKMLVMSSIFEGFGNVLVEGMIAGTPVVSTNCKSGPSEILAGGKYGELVDVGDVQSLATAMINTLKNPVDPELLQQRGQEFSLGAALDSYQQLFDVASKLD
jgi:glycosyltransferase involved in cell wall biosynthesis